MYLDFYDGVRNPRDVPHLECLMYFPEKFDVETSRKAMENADIVIIEISSKKIFNLNDCYYSLKMVHKHGKRDVIMECKQSEEELVADLREIQRRINKPVVFAGHVDLNFHDIPGVNGHIGARSHIDEVIRSYCENFIILKDLFVAMNYKEVCRFSVNEHDTHHITNSSKRYILNALKAKGRELLGTAA